MVTLKLFRMANLRPDSPPVPVIDIDVTAASSSASTSSDLSIRILGEVEAPPELACLPDSFLFERRHGHPFPRDEEDDLGLELQEVAAPVPDVVEAAEAARPGPVPAPEDAREVGEAIPQAPQAGPAGDLLNVAFYQPPPSPFLRPGAVLPSSIPFSRPGMTRGLVMLCQDRAAYWPELHGQSGQLHLVNICYQRTFTENQVTIICFFVCWSLTFSFRWSLWRTPCGQASATAMYVSGSPPPGCLMTCTTVH